MAENDTTTLAEDQDLHAFRDQYYGLLVGLLWKEPEPAQLDALSSGLAERAEAAGRIHPDLGEGWELIGKALQADAPHETVVREYTTLFLGPFQPELALYESRYLVDAMYHEPLITVREFMKQVGLEKTGNDYREPEDNLAFELEIMHWLLQRQLGAAGGPEAGVWLERQADFAKEHLLCWVSQAARDMRQAESAVFYRGVAALLAGFMELEQEVLAEIGDAPLMDLEAARKKYQGRPMWRGPTVEFGQDGEDGGGKPN